MNRKHSFHVTRHMSLVTSLFFTWRHRILGSEGHPGHATEQARCGEPDALWETMDLHRPLRILRASRLKTAPDKMFPPGLEKKAVAFYDDFSINNHRDLRT